MFEVYLKRSNGFWGSRGAVGAKGFPGVPGGRGDESTGLIFFIVNIYHIYIYKHEFICMYMNYNMMCR